MATDQIAFLADAVEHEEHKNSSWFKEPLPFAKAQHSFLNLHQRYMDDSLETTSRALEDVLSLLMGDFLSPRIGDRMH